MSTGHARARTRRDVDEVGDATDPLGDLLCRAGHGDQRAFAELYDTLAPLLHGIVLKIVRDPAQSEEVTQEAFVELWRLAPRYDASRGSVRSWATTLAHRRAIDRVRSEQSARDRTEREAQKRPTSVDRCGRPGRGGNGRDPAFARRSSD